MWKRGENARRRFWGRGEKMQTKGAHPRVIVIVRRSRRRGSSEGKKA
jgi:hypothetical protein